MRFVWPCGRLSGDAFPILSVVAPPRAYEGVDEPDKFTEKTESGLKRRVQVPREPVEVVRGQPSGGSVFESK